MSYRVHPSPVPGQVVLPGCASLPFHRPVLCESGPGTSGGAICGGALMTIPLPPCRRCNGTCVPEILTYCEGSEPPVLAVRCLNCGSITASGLLLNGPVDLADRKGVAL